MVLHNNLRFDCLERKIELEEIAKIVGVAAVATVAAGSLVAVASSAVGGTVSTATAGTTIL